MKIPNFFKIKAKANQSLEREVQEELKKPDPELSTAKAVLQKAKVDGCEDDTESS